MTILRPENQRTPVSIHNAQSENGKRKTRIVIREVVIREVVIREVVISRLESERGFQLQSIHDFVFGHRKTGNFSNQMNKRTRIAITATIINYDLL